MNAEFRTSVAGAPGASGAGPSRAAASLVGRLIRKQDSRGVGGHGAPTISRLRVLIVDTYYSAFLRAHFADRKGTDERSYAEQLGALMARRMGTSDAYSHYLRAHGHEAEEVVANCVPLQLRWAEEHSLSLRGGKIATRVPGPPGRAGTRAVLRRILDAQIAAFAPDVVYIQDTGLASRSRLDRLRAADHLVVGQVGSAAPGPGTLRGYDLVTTSFPHFVERFRALGIDTEFFRIGFDPRVTDDLARDGVSASPDAERPLSAVFVGGLAPEVPGHGTKVLEDACAAGEVDVWGYGADRLPPASAVRGRYRGEAWGLDMYRVLARSRIALNRHGDIAEGHANNMRLYEATGVGALLLTDGGSNLGELFEPGSEVVTYSDADDLIEKLRHYAGNNDERRTIAAAGQRRTLREHSYERLMAELADILASRLP